MSVRALCCWSVCVAVALCERVTLGQSFTFQKVVDNYTTVPGTSDKYTFLNQPAFDGTNVAFIATIPNPSGTSINVWKGGPLTKIADFNTAVPGAANSVFKSFKTCSIDGGTTVFDAQYLHNGEVVQDQGVYQHTSSLQLVANSDVTYFSLGYPTISQGVTAFVATEQAPSTFLGIYTAPGGRVVDNSMNIPGTATKFGSFDKPVIDGANIAFYGSKDITYALPNGIYLSGAGGLSTIITSGSAVPGVADTFASLNRIPALDGTDVAFIGYGNIGGYSGVFSRIGGSLMRIADTSTPIPGGSGNFTSFANTNSSENVAIDQGQVLFVGLGNSFQSGLYLYTNGSLVKVLKEGDTLDGKTITRIGSTAAFRISVNAFRDGKFAFYVQFGTGGSNDNAIYIGTIGSGGGCGARQLLEVAKPLIPAPIKRVLPGRLSALDRPEQVLADLRRFRDEVLQPTDVGRRLATAYYAHSPAVVKSVISSPELLVESIRLLDEVHVIVKTANHNERMAIVPRTTFERGLRWLEAVETRLSPNDRTGVAGARQLLVDISESSDDVVRVRFGQLNSSVELNTRTSAATGIVR